MVIFKMDLSFAAASLALSALTIACAQGGSLKAERIVYENVARTFSEKIENGVWLAGEVIPRRLLKSQDEDVMFSEVLGYPLHDCSDAEYRCIFSSHRVYAVPKTRLSPAETYAVGGSVFRVEECLRGDANTCQVALISSDCQGSTGKDACEEVLGGRGNSKNVGSLIYFIYNEDFGVTAFGVTDRPVGSATERLAIASQMILQGRHGLLAK